MGFVRRKAVFGGLVKGLAQVIVWPIDLLIGNQRIVLLAITGAEYISTRIGYGCIMSTLIFGNWLSRMGFYCPLINPGRLPYGVKIHLSIRPSPGISARSVGYANLCREKVQRNILRLNINKIIGWTRCIMPRQRRAYWGCGLSRQPWQKRKKYRWRGVSRKNVSGYDNSRDPLSPLRLCGYADDSYNPAA